MSIKQMFIYSLAGIALLGLVVLLLHAQAQYKQAQRELIFIKARQQADQVKQQRHLQYKKRLEEQKLKREYEKGIIVQ